MVIKEQGKHNGSDFILENKISKKTIGWEITEYAKLQYDISKINKKDIFFEKIYKKLDNLMNVDMEEKLKKITIVENEKASKIKNYIKTDEIKLDMIMNNIILPE